MRGVSTGSRLPGQLPVGLVRMRGVGQLTGDNIKAAESASTLPVLP